MTAAVLDGEEALDRLLSRTPRASGLIPSELTIAAGTSCGRCTARASTSVPRRRSRARRRARPRARAVSCRHRRARSASTSELSPRAGAPRPSRAPGRGRSCDSGRRRRALPLGGGHRHVRQVEREVLAQDRRVQALQLGAGLDAGRLDEHDAGVAIRPRAPRPAVRCDRARASAEPRAARGSDARSAGAGARSPSAPCDPRRGQPPRAPPRDQPLLLQSRDLRRRERLERQVRERRPMPQLQRLAQHAPARSASPSSSAALTLRHVLREALGVKLARTHLQPVTGRRVV